MSKFPHDEFAKNYLTELLNTIGKANANELINSERREGDVSMRRRNLNGFSVGLGFVKLGFRGCIGCRLSIGLG